MLSSPALDLLRRVRERLTSYPTSTLFLAAECVAEEGRDDAVLEQFADLDAGDLSGIDAVEWIDGQLAAQGATIPAPPPTVPAPAPTVEAPEPTVETLDDDALILALGRLGETWEHLEAARVALRGHREGELYALLQGAEALAWDLGAEIEARVLGLGEAAE